MSLEIPGEAEDEGMDEAGSSESIGWKKEQMSFELFEFWESIKNSLKKNSSINQSKSLTKVNYPAKTLEESRLVPNSYYDTKIEFM